ncbi:Uncharacterised protein [Halioglobus japonicus]|nr:Uncharacterised protein [Halioglobus japonicus]
MESIETRRQEKFWNQLVNIISRKDVVPVIGEDLLIFDESSGAFVYDELAKRYAEFAEITLCLDQDCALSATVRNHPDFNLNPHDISQEIGEEFEVLNPPIPSAIRQLAKIRDFNLFVTTSFDDLLEKALNEERFNGEKKTRIISYSPKKIPSDDEIGDALSSGFPVVFQLFGSYKNPLNFALTEGDKLEYFHALHSSEHSPKAILNELYNRPLLLIGNKFPDWLTRTFLRLTRKTSLDNREVPKQYLSGSEAKSPTLSYFLEHFTANTEVVKDYSPADFTERLAEKWHLKTQQSTEHHDSSQVSIKHRDALYKPPPPSSVFISYAATKLDGSESPDKAIAIQLRNRLMDAGVNAWMDIDELNAGDDYARKIHRFISNCGLFVPIISPITDSREDGFFRREWHWATERLMNFAGANRRFIVPIIDGGLDPYASLVPEEFKNLHFYKWDEASFDKLVNDIVSIYQRDVAQ